MQNKYYYPINSETKEVLNPVLAQFRGGIYHIPRNSLTVEPLPKKAGFAVVAVLDKNGIPVGSEYKEDNRGLTVYDKSNCLNSDEVSELGQVKEGFTKLAPASNFDKWDGEKWVTDVDAKYIHDYAQVDEVRSLLYSQLTDSLENELARKKRQGKLDEVKILSDRIDEIEMKIKIDNPWPIKP